MYFAWIPYGSEVGKIFVWVGETCWHPHGSQRPPFWKFDIVDPTSSWFTQLCMKSHERTFAKVDKAVHDNIFEVGLSFRAHKCRGNGQICPFSFEDIILLLTVDPCRVISNHRDGSCQLSSLLGGFRRFHFGWSFRFQQIIFHKC